MGQPAARLTDNHTCPMVTPPPHVGGPILPPCEPTDAVNTLAHARAGDKAQCTGPVDFIVTGAATVFVGGKPATRVGEKSMHGGVIVPPCSPDVFIGGPSVGVVLGNPEEARRACQAAAAGRTSGTTQQSYQNCGVESSRQLVNRATGGSVNENAILDRAMNNNWAERVTDASGATVYADSGGTNYLERQSILGSYGVTSTTPVQNMDTIQQAVAEGRGVISSHEAGALWGTTQQGGHAVTTTGVRYGADGKPVSVFINDTGSGECGREVPVGQYQGSLRAGGHINVTDASIW